MPTRICFAYLDKLRSVFNPKFSRDPPSGFKNTIKTEMENYNNPNSDRIRGLQSKLDAVKGTMLENIEKVLQRGVKLEEVLEGSERLSQHAVAFRSKSTQLQRQLCRGNVKLTAILVCIVLLVILFIAIGVCGITFSSCGSGKGNPSPTISPSLNVTGQITPK